MLGQAARSSERTPSDTPCRVTSCGSARLRRPVPSMTVLGNATDARTSCPEAHNNERYGVARPTSSGEREKVMLIKTRSSGIVWVDWPPVEDARGVVSGLRA